MPHEPLTYYMHRCNPLALPRNDTSTKLTCKPKPETGTFQCYFGQVSLCLSELVMLSLGQNAASTFGRGQFWH